MKFEDLTGKRFGRLTVIKRAPNSPASPSTRWHCVCDCGNETISYGTQLKNGSTKSCGCYGREKQILSAVKHGGRNTRLYHIWAMMKQRTENPKHTAYKNYGACGVKVCKMWHDDFAAFREWAYAAGYRDELTIDRIDNNGDYEPENCRWVDRTDQNRNQRQNVQLEYGGKKQLMTDWAKEIGISEQALYRRINVLHWPLERALTEKNRAAKKKAPDAGNI